MADDSDDDSEGFYYDPFEKEDREREDFSGDEEDDDDGCLGLCGGGPSDDDDSNGEEMCEVPCCHDDDDDGGGGSDSEDLCASPRDDDDGGESEEVLSDDDDDGIQDEEVCDEEGNGEELVDDPCDEDDGEGDGAAQDLCEDPSSHDSEEDEREVFCVSGFSIAVADGTDSFDSSEGDISSSSSSDEVDDESFMPVALPLARPVQAPSSEVEVERQPVHALHAFRVMLAADFEDDIDYDSDDDEDTDYDDYEVHRLPASRAVVESLPEATLSEEEATCDCAVCKEVFESEQRLVSLPCKHYFHDHCIRPWLAIRSTCPMCRYQLPTNDAQCWQGQALPLRMLEPVALHGETHQRAGAPMEATAAEPPQAQGTSATESSP